MHARTRCRYVVLPLATLLAACVGDSQHGDETPSVITAVRPSLPIARADGGSDDATMNTDDAESPADASMPSDDAEPVPTDDASTGDDAGMMTTDDVPPPPPPPPPPPMPVGGFDSATDAHIRDIVARGASRGNRREVFAKIGDSISESASFLWDCGYGWYDLGPHTELLTTINYFRATPLADRNSLNRSSLCAVAGWTAGDALDGYPDCALTRELDAIQPMWAIVMYGTNDMQRGTIDQYRANLAMVLDVIEGRDVVPIMSTIPPRGDGEPYATLAVQFNEVVREYASARHLPLIDLYAALVPLPGEGLNTDGIHPNTYNDPADSYTDACDMTPAGLEYGYNVRNFTALQMLERLRAY